MLTAHAMARTYLRDRECRLWPWMEVNHLERLVASLGAGLDPLAGEEPVAFVVSTGQRVSGVPGFVAVLLDPIRLILRGAMGRIDWDHGVLLTDERVVIRDWLDSVDAPYEAVEHPESRGGSVFEAEHLAMNVLGERWQLCVPGVRPLQRFLEVAAGEARGERIRIDRFAPPFPAPGDPSGARGFLARVRVRDERASLLLGQIAEGSDREALDLARRVALLHRTTVGARGSHEGLWVSPLRPEEFLAFCDARLGQVCHTEEEEGLRCHRYTWVRSVAREAPASSLKLDRDRLDRARPAGDVRVAVAGRSHPSAGAYTAYRLENRSRGAWLPLSTFESEALFHFHKELLAFEVQILLRRVLFGSELSVDELLELPSHVVDGTLQTRAGASNPRWFRGSRTFGQAFKRVKQCPERGPVALADLPDHLPEPPSLLAPVEVTGIAVVNAIAGTFTTMLFSTAYCFGGVGVLTWAEQAVFAKVPGMDEQATAGAFVLGLILQYVALLIAGPIRAFLGLLLMVAPSLVRQVGALLVLMGIVGVVVADVPGVVASGITLLLLFRPAVRGYGR